MSNRLQNERSPYLLQHAHNPVDWYPWCEEAFERARREGLPVLVSIGYSACHWCHVMEEESFEDPATARFMNEHFINIKVDREERPEIDHFYMDAVQAMIGTGGWPLNVFTTPDKKPFYGGTYFPPEPMLNRPSWMDVLQAIRETWEKKKEEIEQQADVIIKHLQRSIFGNIDGTREFTKADLDTIAEDLLKEADLVFGGFGDAPKFPMPLALRYLLEYADSVEEETDLTARARAHVRSSLDKMIEGGIYDQIGGGFSRYATDRGWRIPHFEKMLYDNALLLALYADAFRRTGSGKYRQVIIETLSFCTNELKADTPQEEGFYSAVDADSEGEEGKFYVWTQDQFLQAVPDAHPALLGYFDIRKEGNWEGTNILRRALHRKEILVHFSLTQKEWASILEDAKSRLLDKRHQRVRPKLDDKILLSWNALMVSALCAVDSVLPEAGYLDQAKRLIDWLIFAFDQKEGLKHVYKEGKSYVDANLDDCSFFIKSLLDFAARSGEHSYIRKADELMGRVFDSFSDAGSPFFTFSATSNKDVLVPKHDLFDQPLPSANAALLSSLVILGNIMEKRSYLDAGRAMSQEIAPLAKQFPLSFGQWITDALRYRSGFQLCVFVGEDAASVFAEWRNLQADFPNVYAIYMVSRKELPVLKNIPSSKELNIYLCKEGSCGLPSGSLKEVVGQIKKSG